MAKPLKHCLTSFLQTNKQISECINTQYVCACALYHHAAGVHEVGAVGEHQPLHFLGVGFVQCVLLVARNDDLVLVRKRPEPRIEGSRVGKVFAAARGEEAGQGYGNKEPHTQNKIIAIKKSRRSNRGLASSEK